MKVQQASYFSLSLSCSLVSAFLDFNYDFCDTSSVLSSLNPLCDKASTSLVDLSILHGLRSEAQNVVGNSHSSDHEHNHDHTHGSDSHPWSHPPYCLHSPNATNQYCVYTDTKFASHRGISFYIDPIYSDPIHELEAFSSPNVLDGTNQATDPRYASKPIPNKGLGLVALTPIHRGEELFRSTPVLIVQEDGVINETERVPFLNQAIRQLPRESKRSFDELKGHFGTDPVQDRVDTNCFAIGLEVEGLIVPATAVFPEMSRMNHDCRPNAHYYFDPHTFIQSVHALRTILPGEEITVSYIDPAQTSELRKEALHTSWGFPCGCNACNAPKPVREASDARITEIRNLQAMLGDYTASGLVQDSRQGVEMAELLVELYELEGMLGPVSEAYAYAALEYSSAMRKYEALRYAHKALEAGLLYGGPKDVEVLSMAELITNPEGHWSWGVRARRRWEGEQQTLI